MSRFSLEYLSTELETHLLGYHCINPTCTEVAYLLSEIKNVLVVK